MRASNCRIRRKPDVQSRSETDVGEFAGVPIVQFDLDPTIFDGLVQPALEIGIPHIEKIIASKNAARSNSVLHKNAEDLASYIFIRCHVMSAASLETTITQIQYRRKPRVPLYPSF